MAIALPPSPRVSPERRKHAEDIVASLVALNPLRVIVFGSWARGQADEYSDLDLVVVMETDKRFIRRLDDWDFPLRMGVDALVYTPEEFEAMRRRGNSFIERILSEGVTLHARSE